MPGTRFESADMITANRECGVRPGKQMPARCENCNRPVILHCGDCKVQVTGCICTEVDRFGKDEAFLKEVERLKEELGEVVAKAEARKRMQDAGFWLPGDLHN